MFTHSNNSGTESRRVAIYIRVSTQEQFIEGYGLDSQRTKLKQYIEGNKAINLIMKEEWIFEDVHTGSDLNRPAYIKLMQKVRNKEVDAVLVWKIDRLSRSLQHLLATFEEFEKNEVAFISVQENLDFRGPIGKLIFQIFGAIAQFERELIKGRTTMGKITSAEMGNYTGAEIPYGYTPVPNENGKGKKLVIIPGEKKWVEKMYEWYVYEGLGFGQIAKRLNQMKVPRGKYSRIKSKTGSWTDMVVTKIFDNPIYRGYFVANKKDETGHLLPTNQWTKVPFPPCVSEILFQLAQHLRTVKVPKNLNSCYMLSGKLKDITLTHPKNFVGVKRFKGGFSYRRKQFDKDGKHYPVFEVPGKQIDEYVWEQIMKALKSPEIFIKQYLSSNYVKHDKLKELADSIQDFRKKRVDIDMSLSRIEQAYENGSYDEEKYKEKASLKSQELQEIDIQIEKLEHELQFLGSVEIEISKLKEASKKVKYRLDNLSLKQKQELCNFFVDRVEMRRHKENNDWQVGIEVFLRFNPDKVAIPSEIGRTVKSLSIAKKGVPKNKTELNGGGKGSSYFLFHFSAYLHKIGYYNKNRNKVHYSQTVVLENKGAVATSQYINRVF